MQNKPHSLTVKNVAGKWQDLPMPVKKVQPCSKSQSRKQGSKPCTAPRFCHGPCNPKVQLGEKFKMWKDMAYCHTDIQQREKINYLARWRHLRDLQLILGLKTQGQGSAPSIQTIMQTDSMMSSMCNSTAMRPHWKSRNDWEEMDTWMRL